MTARVGEAGEPFGYGPADVERQTAEPRKMDDVRNPFEIDRARILHAAAFRQLQRKTQVFPPGESDFFRSRLTHSLEVSQIAKGMALRLGADPTLCEAAGLAHDIGHPPFGHAGERVLDACMRNAGGFEGNAQNLRVLSRLEVKSERFRGLNLTRATLDAILKYKCPRSQAAALGRDKFFYDDDQPLVDWVCQGRGDREQSLECQIVEWADDVAYSVHDVEDGMQAGLIASPRLHAEGTRALLRSRVPDASIACIDTATAELAAVSAVAGARSRHAARKTWTSAAIHSMVIATHTQPRDDGSRGSRYARSLRVDEPWRTRSRVLKALAASLVFGDPRVMAVHQRAEAVVRGLFERLVADASSRHFPEELRDLLDEGLDRRRVACDFIAGMTDEF
ncbi:MAG: deoxyguanosinetriphosphate triphosphohydrolase family protein, partial [Chloroflexota bacterium]